MLLQFISPILATSSRASSPEVMAASLPSPVDLSLNTKDRFSPFTENPKTNYKRFFNTLDTPKAVIEEKPQMKLDYNPVICTAVNPGLSIQTYRRPFNYDVLLGQVKKEQRDFKYVPKPLNGDEILGLYNHNNKTLDDLRLQKYANLMGDTKKTFDDLVENKYDSMYGQLEGDIRGTKTEPHVDVYPKKFNIKGEPKYTSKVHF